MIRVPAVHLLHGKGGSPDGTVAKLQECLQQHWPELKYFRPALPNGKPTVPAEVVAILATSRATWIAQAIFVLAALIWMIPDRRIAKRLAT